MTKHTQVHAVGCGEDALAFLRHEGAYMQAPRPDLICLDLLLPGIDGLAVFTQLQADPAVREILVAIWSDASEEKQQQLEARGPVAAYLTKSLDLDLMLRQLTELLDTIQPQSLHTVESPQARQERRRWPRTKRSRLVLSHWEL